MAQTQYPKPHKPNAQGGDNTLQALILHQHQQAVQQAQQQLVEAQNQMKKVQAEAEEHKKASEKVKKQSELDKKLHEETRKELEKYKSQYDAKHIMEKKTVNRETMQRARLAKTSTKKAVREGMKAQKPNATKKAKPRAAAPRTRKKG